MASRTFPHSLPAYPVAASIGGSGPGCRPPSRRRTSSSAGPSRGGASLCNRPTVLSHPKVLVRASAFPSAHHVVGVARGALIDRTRTPRPVLGHVGRDLEPPEGQDEVAAVIALGRSGSDPARQPQVVQHLQRRGALGATGGHLRQQTRRDQGLCGRAA